MEVLTFGVPTKIPSPLFRRPALCSRPQYPSTMGLSTLPLEVGELIFSSIVWDDFSPGCVETLNEASKCIDRVGTVCSEHRDQQFGRFISLPRRQHLVANQLRLPGGCSSHPRAGGQSSCCRARLAWSHWGGSPNPARICF